MAEPGGFSQIPNAVLRKYRDDSVRLQAVIDLYLSMDYKTRRFGVGARALAHQNGLTRSAAQKLIDFCRLQNRVTLGCQEGDGRVTPNGHSQASEDEMDDNRVTEGSHEEAPSNREYSYDINSPSESVAANGDDGAQRIDYQRYADAWNHVAAQCGWTKVVKLSESRKRQLRARLKDQDFDWKAILEAARSSQGLRGQQWFSFDWLLKNDQNYLKVLEGKYKRAFGAQPEQTLPTKPDGTPRNVL